MEQTKKYSRTSKEHQKLTRAVTTCIATDSLPIYSVDKSGFQEMINVLNPRYDLPHREHFSRIAIPALYEETRQDLLEQLEKECSYFSLTTDLWSSTSLQPYMSLTVHYIDCSREHLTASRHTMPLKTIQVKTFQMLSHLLFRNEVWTAQQNGCYINR